MPLKELDQLLVVFKETLEILVVVASGDFGSVSASGSAHAYDLPRLRHLKAGSPRMTIGFWRRFRSCRLRSITVLPYDAFSCDDFVDNVVHHHLPTLRLLRAKSGHDVKEYKTFARNESLEYEEAWNEEQEFPIP